MSTENVSPATSEASELDESKQNERRRSTTVIMTMNVTMPAETNGDGPISLLSISDDPSESSEKSVPCIEEHPEEGKEETDDNPHIEKDGMKLRPPDISQKKMWSASKSLSRESTGTEYSDRSGTDLRTFVDRTLHKSEEDRKQLLEFEKELRNLILDESVQSRKFELPSSYHRMLLHRCAAWFGLDHNVTNKQTDIVVNKSERTKIPEEIFTDYIRHDNFAEDRFKRQNTGGSRKELHHMESFGERNSQYGSQASLNHDLLMMRRAQSFDVAPVTGQSVMPSPPQHNRGLPIRQLSLNCTQQPIVGSPINTPQGHQWAPQRSFDCSNNSYLCTGKHPIMRKAESFGGMANGISHGCYEPNVPMVCQTPPSVMVHHHHHHAHVQQQPATNYTGYQVFDEMTMGSPSYPESGMCSPGGTYYEYVPQVVPPQQYARPIRYVSHEYQQRRPPSSRIQYMYGPPQYVQYQPMVHPEVEVIVDPVQSQPFPPVGHFVVPPTDQQQGYSSSHQAETANSFIKASIDGGYGSMNQETDSSGNAEKVEEVAV
uniref:R3H domain-containing protein n=1 Tax=Caenorhabditis tropicalis TaxID=1561998 RepID=A0A1I7TML5_9PELO